MGLFSGLVGTIAGIAQNGQNYNLQKEAYEYNKDFQERQFEYNKGIQQDIFAREDNAQQRAVADAEKAGINKQLMAGSGANAGAVVGVTGRNQTAPQMSGVAESLSSMPGLSELLTMQNQYLNNARTQADIAKTQVETENARLAGLGTSLQNEIMTYDFDATKSGWGRRYKDSPTLVEGLARELSTLINNMLPKKRSSGDGTRNFGGFDMPSLSFGSPYMPNTKKMLLS